MQERLSVRFQRALGVEQSGNDEMSCGLIHAAAQRLWAVGTVHEVTFGGIVLEAMAYSLFKVWGQAGARHMSRGGSWYPL